MEQNVEIIETYELPAGYVDKEGNTHRTFEIKEITGVEEEAIARNDIKQSGAKIMRTILERCCLRIGSYYRKEVGVDEWRNIINSLTVSDQDYILLKIREATTGNEIEASLRCIHCGAKLNLKVDTREFEITPFSGSYEFDFELPKGYKDPKTQEVYKTGKLRYPTGLDREVLDPVLKKNAGEANTLMLVRCMKEFTGVRVSNDVIKSLSLKDRTYLLDLFKEKAFGISLESECTCSECGGTFTGTLNLVNFI